jgi:hypothetical protein
MADEKKDDKKDETPKMVMKDANPEVAKATRRPAKVQGKKSVDETVKGGMIIKPMDSGDYVVVDAEGEPIDGKSVVFGEHDTLEIVDA